MQHDAISHATARRRAHAAAAAWLCATGQLFAAEETAQGAAQAEPADWFVDATSASGLTFSHFNGMTGDLEYVEVVGAGGALFDYDNDGDLDLYLVQGAKLSPDHALSDALFPPTEQQLPLIDRLYRNDLRRDGNGRTEVRWTDVTEASGIRAAGYGMGVAAGDVNNDGWIDLYVMNFGPNQMFLNDGDGTFTEATAATGTGEPRWSASASFLDYDRDGWLDLYVGNYVYYSLENSKPCRSTAGRREYCGPKAYTPEKDVLFHNTGNGRFVDVTEEAGIDQAYGGALGIVSADFNGDGWIDVYVANDGLANQLWLNQGNGTFVDDALLAGASVNSAGMPEASMGVDAADFDGDGDEDLFMTHLFRETNTLYVNDGQGWFEDRTIEMGLAQASKIYTGFGMGWLDFDNDGWLDLLAANGAVQRIDEQLEAGDPHPLKQRNQLFVNRGDGRYEEVTDRAGAAFRTAEVSRGAVFGDVDNDGDTDVVITNNQAPARLLLNETGHRNAWLGLRLMTAKGVRDAYGARVAVDPDGERPLWRRVRADASYASSNDPRVLIGLGARAKPQDVLVVWPDGLRERWSDLAPNHYHTLESGSGRQVKP